MTIAAAMWQRMPVAAAGEAAGCVGRVMMRRAAAAALGLVTELACVAVWVMAAGRV